MHHLSALILCTVAGLENRRNRDAVERSDPRMWKQIIRGRYAVSQPQPASHSGTGRAQLFRILAWMYIAERAVSQTRIQTRVIHASVRRACVVNMQLL